jgi:hypothetical protein
LRSQKYIPLALTPTNFTFVLLFLSVLLISCSLFQNAFAASPAFDQIFITDEEITNQINDWVQTYGNDITQLMSDYANLRAVDYLSDGGTLDATLWLDSNLENASTYSQPLKRIRYGMLIAIVSLPITSGYNGANYNFYIESVDGKWSEYLYQLSSTGAYVLTESEINYTKPFGGLTIGPGYVKLRLDLRSINYPSKYGLLFYTAESFKSNEVRDFTTWIAIPPSTIDILTTPNNMVIRKVEQRIIPDYIKTTLSNNVTSITFGNGQNDVGSDFNSNGLHVSIQRIQPPLFNVEVPSQTPVGIYTVPFTASVLIQTTVTSTKPIFNHTVSGFVDPEFQSSKKYPTIGYITNPLMNLTITVIPPLTINDKFKDFWSIYGQPISIVVGGFAGGFASLVFGRIRSRTT